MFRVGNLRDNILGAPIEKMRGGSTDLKINSIVKLEVAGVELKKKQATGHRGSWFAKVDSEPLPCVHKYWLTRMEYHDPFRRHDGRENAKINELVEAVKECGKVILTDDEVSFDAFGNVIGFKRTRYIGVFRVSDVRYDEVDGLRFILVERLCSLS
jgi:hypothetical protein